MTLILQGMKLFMFISSYRGSTTYTTYFLYNMYFLESNIFLEKWEDENTWLAQSCAITR